MSNSPPLLGVVVSFQLVSELVGSIWTFGFTAVEPTLFRVVGMDTSRPPHFDGTNFPYYKARMACHLEDVYLSVWRVTRNRMKPLRILINPQSVKKKIISMLELNIVCFNLLAWMCLTKCLL